MYLKELIDGLNVAEMKNYQEDIQINGIAYHSEKVEDRFIYVAIKGYITDGHLFTERAIERGAAALLVEEFVQDCDLPQIRVVDTREGLSRMSSTFYGDSSKDMTVIGVTATNGKTTTTYMLNQIYEYAGFKTGLIGSVMNKVGDKFVPSELTTPESLDLQRLFHNMKSENINTAIMEVSSSALELKRVNDVDYDIVSFNNFSREHIDQHGSFERYWEIKSGLITNAKEGAYALLNIDDERIRKLVDETKANVITYSLKDDNAMIYIRDIQLNKGRANFFVVINENIKGYKGDIEKGEFWISMGIPGLHSIENALTAISIALTDGIDRDIIAKALNEFPGVERRFEYIYERDFLIIDDHFANLKNINVTLETLSKIPGNKLHIIYAIRGNRGVTTNKENAEMLVSWKDRLGIDEIVGTKSIGSVGKKDTVSDEEESVFVHIIKESGLNLQLYDTLEDAISYSLSQIEKDDIVLLAGCQGMDNGAKIAFDFISSKYPDIDKEELYKPLGRRAMSIDN